MTSNKRHLLGHTATCTITISRDRNDRKTPNSMSSMKTIGSKKRLQDPPQQLPGSLRSLTKQKGPELSITIGIYIPTKIVEGYLPATKIQTVQAYPDLLRLPLRVGLVKPLGEILGSPYCEVHF